MSALPAGGGDGGPIGHAVGTPVWIAELAADPAAQANQIALYSVAGAPGQLFARLENGAIVDLIASGGTAPADAPYLTDGAVVDLTAERNIQALATPAAFTSVAGQVSPLQARPTLAGGDGATAVRSAYDVLAPAGAGGAAITAAYVGRAGYATHFASVDVAMDVRPYRTTDGAGLNAVFRGGDARGAGAAAGGSAILVPGAPVAGAAWGVAAIASDPNLPTPAAMLAVPGEGLEVIAAVDRPAATAINATLKIRRTVLGGLGAAGIGVSTRFEIENAGGSAVGTGEIQSVYTVATAGTEEANLVYQTIRAGALVEIMRMVGATRDLLVGTTVDSGLLSLRRGTVGTVLAIRNTADTATTLSISDAGVLTGSGISSTADNTGTIGTTFNGGRFAKAFVGTRLVVGTPTVAETLTPCYIVVDGAGNGFQVGDGTNPGITDSSLHARYSVASSAALVDAFSNGPFVGRPIALQSMAANTSGVIIGTATAMVGTERLRVVGSSRLEGAVTVKPTAAGAALAIRNTADTATTLSISDTGVITGPSGLTLTDPANGFWTSNGGFIASPGNGYRSSAYEIAGSALLFSLSGVGTNQEVRLTAPGTGSITNYVEGASRLDVRAVTVASAAGAIWDLIRVPNTTAIVTGAVGITTATGFNMVEFGQPTLSAASALTISDAATVHILGAPIGGGAGPATITRAYCLWLDSGTMRYDDNIALGTVLAAIGNVPAGAVAAQNEWLRVNVGGNVRYIPVWA